MLLFPDFILCSWSQIVCGKPECLKDSYVQAFGLTISRLVQVLDGHGVLGRSGHVGHLAITAGVFKTRQWVVLRAGHSSMVMGVLLNHFTLIFRFLKSHVVIQRAIGSPYIAGGNQLKSSKYQLQESFRINTME